jgi:hypothetical protein
MKYQGANLEKPIFISIFDYSGVLVQTFEISDGQSFSPNLKAGLYLVQIKSENTCETKTYIVQ